MPEKKKRRKTGCLTCRARRVKCDEAKPKCERCLASNVECLGYQQKRQIAIQCAQLQPTACVPGAVPLADEQNGQLALKYRNDQQPLVALPCNPRPSQRPHARARHILAYHQYLFRTVSILFPPEHYYFWKDWLCEQAWESEVAFDAIIALGTIHRAALLKSEPDANARNRSLDTSVIAEQAYTQALQESSQIFGDPGSLNEVHVAVILLLAYFECFAGNITATYRHLRLASHCLTNLATRSEDQDHRLRNPLWVSIGTLNRLCRAVLPCPALDLDDSPLAPTTAAGDHRVSSASANAASMDLYALSASPPEIHDLVWIPLKVDRRSLSRDQIFAFQETVETWRRKQLHLPTHSPTEHDQLGGVGSDRHVIDSLVIPPNVRKTTSAEVCILEGTCELYLARATWTLSLLGHDPEENELSAYSHCYQAMSWIGTAAIMQESPEASPQEGSRQHCEILERGLLPIFYLLGQMSPKQEWRQWVIERMERIKNEGLYDGHALAKTLRILRIFEMRDTLDSPSEPDRLPRPRRRIVPMLVPDPTGCGFTAYYFCPESNETRGDLYNPLGRACWSNGPSQMSSSPDIEFLSSQQTYAGTSVDDWLLAQKPVQDWLDRAGDPGFDLDRALSDHISNSRLLRAIQDQEP